MFVPSEERSASEAATVFGRLADEVLRLRGRLLTLDTKREATALSGSQLLVLSSVVRSRTPPTVPRIGRSLGHSRQAIQRIVDDLVEGGYVTLTDNPDHKRARLLVPTERGKITQAAGADHTARLAAYILQGIPPAHVEAATRMLQLMRERIQAVPSLVAKAPPRK